MTGPVKTRMIDELDSSSPSNSSIDSSSLSAVAAMEVESRCGNGEITGKSEKASLSTIFNTFDKIKCGLVAISLSLRSGSATSSDTLNLSAATDQNNSNVVSVPTCKNFLGLLKLPDPKKKAEATFIKKLPCFGPKKKKEIIKGLTNNPKWKSQKWRVDNITATVEEITELPTTSKTVSDSASTSCTVEEIVQKAIELGQNLMKSDAPPLDYANGDIMGICNLVADGACLSLLSLLYDLLEAAGTVIAPNASALSKVS